MHNSIQQEKWDPRGFLFTVLDVLLAEMSKSFIATLFVMSSVEPSGVISQYCVGAERLMEATSSLLLMMFGSAAGELGGVAEKAAAARDTFIRLYNSFEGCYFYFVIIFSVYCFSRHRGNSPEC